MSRTYRHQNTYPEFFGKPQQWPGYELYAVRNFHKLFTDNLEHSFSSPYPTWYKRYSNKIIRMKTKALICKHSETYFDVRLKDLPTDTSDFDPFY